MNGCGCKSPFSAVAEFLDLCQDGINASLFLGIMWKNNDTSVNK
jgi:hypothetical protein